MFYRFSDYHSTPIFPCLTALRKRSDLQARQLLLPPSAVPRLAPRLRRHHGPPPGVREGERRGTGGLDVGWVHSGGLSTMPFEMTFNKETRHIINSVFFCPRTDVTPPNITPQ